MSKRLQTICFALGLWAVLNGVPASHPVGQTSNVTLPPVVTLLSETYDRAGGCPGAAYNARYSVHGWPFKTVEWLDDSERRCADEGSFARMSVSALLLNLLVGLAAVMAIGKLALKLKEVK